MGNESDRANSHPSRRRFIGGGAAAAAALTLGPPLLAACGSAGSGGSKAQSTSAADGRATVVRNVRPLGGPPVDLIAVDGVIAHSVPDGCTAPGCSDGRTTCAPTSS